MFDGAAPNDRRLQRIHKLRQQGIEPYAQTFHKSCNLLDIRQDFSYVSHGGVGMKFDLCGRVIGFREEDDLLLVELEEQQAQLLFVLHAKWVGYTNLNAFKENVFVGDYLGFSIDKIFRLQSRELATRVIHWTMLAPCIVEPPFDELSEELRYRHLQLIVDRTARRRFVTRSKIVQYIRRFLEDELDFLEVSIPVGPSEETSEWRRSDLKRLLVGGIESIYEISGIFNDESLAYCGYPQSQLLDCFKVLAETGDMMRMVERLICALATEFFGNYVIPGVHSEAPWREVMPRLAFDAEHKHAINLKPSWPIHRFYDLVYMRTGIAFLEFNSVEQAVAEVRVRHLEVSTFSYSSVGAIALEIARRYVFPTLQQPTFVTDYPCEVDFNSNRSEDNPRVIKYFELFVNGFRLACGEEQITNPQEFESRFISRISNEVASNQKQKTASENFVHALKCGLPPTAGLHLTIDRLVMLLMNSPDIASIVYFPSQQTDTL